MGAVLHLQSPQPTWENNHIMRIVRTTSRPSFRRYRRRSGCLSFVIVLGVVLGVGLISSNRIIRWFDASHEGAARENNEEIRRQAARAFGSGDLERAVELGRAALASNPLDVGMLGVVVRALIYQSYSEIDRAIDRDSALELVSSAIRGDPLNRDIGAVYAFALAAAGNPVEASEVADRILDADPENALARIAQGLAHGGVGSYSIARRESELAVQSAHTYAGGTFQIDALRALAIAQSDLGDYTGAIATVEQAIGLNGQIVSFYFERALYALQIGDADAATVAYYQVLALQPENVKARLRLCELSSLLRESEQAIMYCTQVVERAAAYAEGWYRLGREYFLIGSFEQARDTLHRCSSLQVMQDVPISERRFECWYLQGQAAEILGDCDSLVATYREYQAMAAESELNGVWIYPPEGPPMCSGR